MKWKGRTTSGNVTDRRIGGSKTAIGGVGIAVLLIYTLITGDPSALLGNLFNGGSSNNDPLTAEEIEMGEFVSVVLADTEVVWKKVFAEYGKVYQPAKLVLYRDTTNSGCGTASSNIGPFYCSADQTIYIDLIFYKELKTRFNAPGDFAMAYVIAHEVGHHIQYQLGILEEFYDMRSKVSTTEFNQLSVRLELQADYMAGVWAHHIQGMGYLEEGDLQEAINAAGAVGDDRIQEQTQGRVTPDNFTHGTSEQRIRWFKKGFAAGDLEDGDTFSATTLYYRNELLIA
ncbi:MAG: metalloprotease [Firmicutes bacterium HGW-Firmicutes-10]|jgi:predicted metalloprotease|nr:MAG: metalloprotease [Firmicutes bacterium HGW-Firmicutes-10]